VVRLVEQGYALSAMHRPLPGRLSFLPLGQFALQFCK